MESQSVNKLPEKYSVIAYTDEQKNKLICYLEEHVKNLVYESDSDSVFHIRSSKYFASSSNCKLDGHILISFEDWERLVKAEKLEKTLKNIEAIVKSTLIAAAAIKASNIVFKGGSTRYEKGMPVFLRNSVFRVTLRFGFPHYCSHEIEYITPEYQKKEITHKINKIETKLSKLNDKREKLLERYKSLGR